MKELYSFAGMCKSTTKNLHTETLILSKSPIQGYGGCMWGFKGPYTSFFSFLEPVTDSEKEQNVYFPVTSVKTGVTEIPLTFRGLLSFTLGGQRSSEVQSAAESEPHV